jgi:hypothetical protein
MGKDYLHAWEYKDILEKTIPEYLLKYQLKIVQNLDHGVELKNERVSVSISFRYKEFELNISNGVVNTSLADFILKQIPDYFSKIKSDPRQAIFQKSEAMQSDAEMDFAYCLKVSFDFLDSNFPSAFKGILLKN